MIKGDVKLGKGVTVFQPELVNLYGCTIGAETKIGAFVEVQKGVKVGKRCKISSHSFICEGVTLEDNVFIGHGVMFINDKYPRATRADGRLKEDVDWKTKEGNTLVKKGASIGSNATILPGLTIGAGAIVGAGSVVTKNVPPGVIVAGSPARILRKIKNE